MTRTTRHSSRLRLEPLEDRLAPATFNVTTTLDVVDPADGKRSLREAVNAANTLAGPDVIVLPAGVYKIALDGAGENINATGDFDISGAVTIRGAGAGSTIIDAQRKDRLFDVISPFAARFVDVTLRGGDGPNNGGAVQALDADLTFVRCAVIDNRSLKGGGVNAENGDVTVTGSTIVRNVAQGFGGGLNLGAGTLTMTGSAVRRNVGSAGGGICTIDATLTGCTINGNSAFSFSGGGVLAFNSITLTGSTVSGNAAGDSGGGIRAFQAATLTDTSVSGNWAGESGGGLSLDTAVLFGTATLTRCTVSGNSAGGSGGGIDTSFATLTKSTISGNSASSVGGGVNTAQATLTNSTVSGNIAGSAGGGINASTATLTNSTVSGNSAATNGGGIRASSATLINCTVVENRAHTGGGLFRDTSGTFNVRNTIVAQNLVDFAGADPDVSGFFTSQGHNLIGDGTGGTGFTDGVNGDIVGTFAIPIDPKLGPLANNGGRTKTHALLAGSRAIDAGDNSLLPPTDQRGGGFPRKKDGNFNGIAVVDIGAFEK